MGTLLAEQISTYRGDDNIKRTFLSFSDGDDQYFGIIMRNALQKVEGKDFADKVLGQFQKLPLFNGKVNFSFAPSGVI